MNRKKRECVLLLASVKESLDSSQMSEVHWQILQDFSQLQENNMIGLQIVSNKMISSGNSFSYFSLWKGPVYDLGPLDLDMATLYEKENHITAHALGASNKQKNGIYTHALEQMPGARMWSQMVLVHVKRQDIVLRHETFSVFIESLLQRFSESDLLESSFLEVHQVIKQHVIDFYREGALEKQKKNN